MVIKVPRTSDNPLCGLCGNNNGDENDDMVTPGNLQLTNAIEFGNAWQDKAEIRGEVHIDQSVASIVEVLKQNDPTAVSE